MIKIWAKILIEGKVIKSAVSEINPKSTTFFDMLKELTAKLNIPTPVLLEKHVYDFNLFHISTFKPFDFIEDVNFDSFTLELLNN